MEKSPCKKSATEKRALLRTSCGRSCSAMEKSPCKINVKFSPKKPSYKKIKWRVKDGKIAYVTPTGIVTGRKEGTTTVIGKTKDGTNKQVKIKVEIKKSVAGPTATPNYENETRKKEIVEDFESYDVGYNWESDDYKIGRAHV